MMESLDWSGSDVDKIESLMKNAISTAENPAPEIKEYRYDFESE